MDQINVHLWQLDPFETPPGAIDFPIEVRGFILRFTAKYTGNPKVVSSVLGPTGRIFFAKPLLLMPIPGNLIAKGKIEFDLRIDRPGRYDVVAETDGQRIAETSFHIRQFPSISRED